MQVEVTWTVPAAAAPRAGPARHHRDGHARRGRRAARRAGVRRRIRGYVRYLNWFLFWSRCETGMCQPYTRSVTLLVVLKKK